MGGPFWAKKDDRAWSIFKGEYVAGEEDPLDAARREFTEETGQPAPGGEPIALGEIRQKSGKRVTAWAVPGEGLDPSIFVSNTFTVEWPPRSGRQQEFPEMDRAAWFPLAAAEAKLVAGQVEFLQRLSASIADGLPD